MTNTAIAIPTTTNPPQTTLTIIVASMFWTVKVYIVNIIVHADVYEVNLSRYSVGMPTDRRAKPLKKPPGQYHHGGLTSALIAAALHTIAKSGADSLTLRGVGKQAGVTQTSVYRHFADKSALLRAVAREGFETLSVSLKRAGETSDRSPKGVDSVCHAYIKFAIENPAHYRVMFATSFAGDPALSSAATAAFQLLVDSLVEQQRAGSIRSDDPKQIGRMIWSLLHGICMLAIDGRLEHQQTDAFALAKFALERMHGGIDI